MEISEGQYTDIENTYDCFLHTSNGGNLVVNLGLDVIMYGEEGQCSGHRMCGTLFIQCQYLKKDLFVQSRTYLDQQVADRRHSLSENDVLSREHQKGLQETIVYHFMISQLELSFLILICFNKQREHVAPSTTSRIRPQFIFASFNLG